MNKQTNNGELPYGFTRWFDLYNRVNWHEHKSGDMIEWEIMSSKGYHKFTYTEDYLKARCFDEVMSYDFTFEELTELGMAVHHYGHSFNGELKSKIDALIRIRHELAYAERFRKDTTNE